MFKRRWTRSAERPRRPSPYETFLAEELILRDYLAVDRTTLANERTLMSYLRTALALVISGASVLHFLSGVATDLAGVALMLGGLTAAAFGARRFIVYRHRIEAVTERSMLPRHPAED